MGSASIFVGCNDAQDPEARIDPYGEFYWSFDFWAVANRSMRNGNPFQFIIELNNDAEVVNRWEFNWNSMQHELMGEA